MKKLILTVLFCAMLFVIGCVHAKYIRETYDDNGKLKERKIIEYSACNMNVEGTGIHVSSPNDVNITMASRKYTADPNSGYAEAAIVKGVAGWFIPAQ